MDRLKNFITGRSFRHAALALGAAAFLCTGMLLASPLGLVGHVHAISPAAVAPSGALPSFADLVETLGPSVVNVKVTKLQKMESPDMPQFPEGPFGDMFRRFFGDQSRDPRQFRSHGAGSGVIVNGDGTILTNNHVIDGAQEITVTSSDGQQYKASVIGRDPKTDLAVLKIDAKGHFVAAKLGDSDTLRVGEWVLAAGNPFGLNNTVTAGIVSAKGRVIGAGPYDDFIQTDAAINPGNSGGPLFNTRGEVIGITTAIIPNGQGIGFAIPVNTAKSLLPELVAKGRVTRGYLGVNIQNLTEELAASLNLKGNRGALVSEVIEGGPADRAGVKRGDVITAFDKKEIKDSHELASLVAATPVNKEVPLRITRDGKELSLMVKVGKLGPEKAEGDSKAGESSQGKWGLQFEDLNPELARQMGLKNDQGVVVVGVRPGSPAENASLQKGDLVLEVDRQPVRSAEDMKKKIEKSTGRDTLLLLLRRGESTFYLALKD